ncbi:serine protease FAM111A-like [Microtus oregoni]|uniref:serine protease FAM111A-like n=1 Tax=Microtus oregoni TaxID=111838 RepID=UPI001BB18F6E|nr:serine protease FAM111A-like [Microtus oregoni]
MGGNPNKYLCNLTHRETGSLYEALNYHGLVKKEIEKQPGKEMLVCGKEGTEGYINLGMPLCCFPQGSHVVITFSETESEEKKNNEVCGRFDQSSAECVVFYIHAVGNREQRILRCRELHEEGTKLCVYGFKGETIKTTLRKDGRFCSFVESDHWKLINNDTIIENSQPVDVLEGKLFQIDVERKESSWEAARTQKSEVEDRNISELKGYIVNLYPTLTGEREKVRACIKEKCENSKEESLLEAYKRKFSEVAKSSISNQMLKLLSCFMDSTGLIVWDNNGNSGRATCFVFRGLYIFTCRHVLNDIVGEGREPSKCLDLISQCVRVTFDDEYSEEPTSNFNSCFHIEPWLLISDDTLDYAVLKLKDNGQHVPAGLYNNGIALVLPSELIYMIGHENGNKVFDRCAVVTQGKGKEKSQQFVHGTEAAGHSHHSKFLHMCTKRSFQEMNVKPNDFTYNIFYNGSSGSPLFDCKGSLVAMHTVGFICEHESGVYNVIEVAIKMESILADIKRKHELWYDDVCVKQQDVEMCSEEFTGQEDVEMCSEAYTNVFKQEIKM